jgi:hypothetical protein
MKSVLLSAVALGACSAPVDPSESPAPPVEASDAPAERYGLVVLSRTVGEPGVSVSGQLLDFEGVTRHEALTALATPDDAWLVADAPDAGTCRALLIEADPIEVAARVDVLDAGMLRVRPPELQGMYVSPRTLPPVVTAIAGVVYDADAPEALPMTPGHWRVQAPGAEVGPVSGEVEAPDGIWLNSAEFDDDGLRVVTTEDDATVLISRMRDAQTLGVVCRTQDGVIDISATHLAHLGAGPADIAVSNVHRAPLRVDGSEAGDLLFVVRDADELHIPLEFR